jgi:nucleotide-binding universal stress UspA family protein
MTEPAWRMLLCTNGADESLPALEYGVWLGKTLQAHVTLLGIVEPGGDQDALEAQLAHSSGLLEESQVLHAVRRTSGPFGETLAQAARAHADLVVLGPLGRPALRRWVRGRSLRRIMAAVEAPILYTRTGPRPIRHILVCLGGLGYAFEVESLSLRLAGAVGARLTLLHVAEPVSFEYPTARKVQDRWPQILETDTPQGRNLRLALAEAERAGVETTFHVRQGSVVHEILEEIDHLGVDLVAMGSPFSAQGLRHLYLPNVTAEVAEAISLPVLTARHKPIIATS